VIEKDTMMAPMLEACPSFRPAWEEFVEEWRSEPEQPLYLALGSLARHLIAALSIRDVPTMSRAFAVVERWLLEGDHYVREAATVGLLEDLQNTNLHEATSPSDFEPYLLPKSLKSWRDVARFWETGEIIPDE
jgi:hypothetical protein